MSVDKKGILSELVRETSQDETFYCEMASILNGMKDKTQYSRNEVLNLCRSYAALSSCVSEEEKTITKLIQLLEDDVYSYNTKMVHGTKRSSSRGGRNALFLSLLDPSSVKVGDRVASFVDGNWIETIVTGRRNDSFSVVDADSSSETPLSLVVNHSRVIRLPPSLGLPQLDVHSYVIPVGTKVLALWPSSTTYYEAVVEARDGGQVQDNEVLIHFEEGGERFVLPYASVIPRPNGK